VAQAYHNNYLLTVHALILWRGSFFLWDEKLVMALAFLQGIWWAITSVPIEERYERTDWSRISGIFFIWFLFSFGLFSVGLYLGILWGPTLEKSPKKRKWNQRKMPDSWFLLLLETTSFLHLHMVLMTINWRWREERSIVSNQRRRNQSGWESWDLFLHYLWCPLPWASIRKGKEKSPRKDIIKIRSKISFDSQFNFLLFLLSFFLEVNGGLLNKGTWRPPLLTSHKKEERRRRK